MKHEAWTLRDWEKEGITWVVVVRERAEGDGWVEAAAYLVDAWCLGVKDTFADELPREELDEFLDHYIPAAERETLEPVCARKLVEGALAYAQSLGFLPHRDFRKTRKILAKVEISACTRAFAFGHEGKPCFIAGADDDDARINRVLAILTAKFGEDGFEFYDETAEEDSADGARMSAKDPAMEDAIDTFFRFIEDGNTPNKALTSFEVDGFITGLHLLPDAIMPSVWLPALWGGVEQTPVFADKAAAEAVIGGAIASYANVAEKFAVSAFEPGVPFVEEEDHVPMSARFCAGVMRAVALRPSICAWFRSHPEGAPAWATLERIAAGESADKSKVPDLGIVIGDALRELHTVTVALRPHR